MANVRADSSATCCEYSELRRLYANSRPMMWASERPKMYPRTFQNPGPMRFSIRSCKNFSQPALPTFSVTQDEIEPAERCNRYKIMIVIQEIVKLSMKRFINHLRVFSAKPNSSSVSSAANARIEASSEFNFSR